MGLWDAVSGKTYRWNAMKLEANRQVCRNLMRWQDAVSQEHSGDAKAAAFASNICDRMYAYFFAAHCGISDELDRDLRQYKAALMALTTSSYLSLISSLHAAHLVLSLAGREELLARLLETAAFVYGRSSSFAEGWHHCLDWLAPDSPRDFAGGIAGKLADEAAAIVGVGGGVGLMVWLELCTRYAQIAKILVSDGPKWHDVVEAEMSAVRRLP